jgi:hypothetical protein
MDNKVSKAYRYLLIIREDKQIVSVTSAPKLGIITKVLKQKKELMTDIKIIKHSLELKGQYREGKFTFVDLAMKWYICYDTVVDKQLTTNLRQEYFGENAQDRAKIELNKAILAGVDGAETWYTEMLETESNDNGFYRFI